MTLLLATRNTRKAQELKRLLTGSGLSLFTLADFPDIPAVAEDHATFRSNAVKKALETSRFTILPVLADDSGLEVKALDGTPGVRSARFAGPSASDLANNRKLLSALAKVPGSRRQARFVCFLALAIGGRLVEVFQGVCEGAIALKPAGRTGFGYDPLFVPRGRRKTMAQLGSRFKDRLSHRAKALAQFQRWLKAF
ncbi:MAG: RdgB/HAM1 family non-canonical purine NTP pyrophosphatase [Candidatus Omnitrophica bacterium]|nr:RdgB/HAM1 family non-canonical purine NTP pyrophosphatase [Candidatus Omnitrophota bacterium]